MTEPELPRGVALAWGVAANPQRGPKRELSIERIVDVGVQLADAGGLASVSMSAIAAELGVSSMALYRYVSAKDDLVLLMQEAAVGVPPESVREHDGWRARLAEWARAQQTTYVEHPWLLDVPITGTPVTPNNLAWMDEGLAALAETTLGDRERVDALLAVLAQTRWSGIIERGITDAARDAGASVADLDRQGAALLAELITPEALPQVHRVLVAGVLAGGGDGVPYDEFGLGLVLDGIAAHLAGRPDATGPAAPGTGASENEPEPPAVLRDPRVKDAAHRRREAERQLREARKREREAIRAARERAGKSG
ncbi:TetR/AcrR family transcriptional regulator [Galbitalea sp. SE-J8]|uniref:TetR/AcrR family transcriptional regulator n=1 Tax=Galbitalea sp. SE-J8 TaxID=3054952 RepID=UPI00259D2FED|nr:TetR/AcrR family transcriptional regulator [Galbitalea sp. SE-J8]MDM4764238.1 TetR/AcrR family transcriptional regulator [Galbitalea sp. SE-J8]